MLSTLTARDHHWSPSLKLLPPAGYQTAHDIPHPRASSFNSIIRIQGRYPLPHPFCITHQSASLAITQKPAFDLRAVYIHVHVDVMPKRPFSVLQTSGFLIFRMTSHLWPYITWYAKRHSDKISHFTELHSLKRPVNMVYGVNDRL